MTIYESEKEIENLITAELKSELVLEAEITDSEQNTQENIVEAKAVENPHPSLMYGSAILVSTVMNRNDDVFLPEEVWKAKETVIDTPYNDQHQKKSIIGHITDYRVLDQDKNIISKDSQEIPEYFDIEVDFVLYKSIFPVLAEDIAKKGPKNKLFVSLEATISDFDYLLIDKEGQGHIIARNKDTAFLTKHLRIYKGTGKYKDYIIARIAKKIVFTGMGNVFKPANPDSEYTRIDNINASENFTKEIVKPFLYLMKGHVMKIDSLEQAQEVIASLQKDLDNKDAVIAQETAKVTEKVTAFEALEKEKNTLSDTLSAEQQKVSAAQQKIDELQTQYNEVAAALEAAKTELKAKTDELANIQAEAKLADRISKMTELGLSVSDEEKNEIRNLSDEAFASVIKFTQSINSKSNKTVDNSNEGDLKASNEAEKEADKALENAEENKDDLKANELAEEIETDLDKAKKAASLIAKVVRPNKENKNVKK